jgi:hypothetical protein
MPHITSVLSGKQFAYRDDPGNNGQRDARRELDAHEQQVREAAEQRAGRPLTAREIRAQLGTRAIEASRAPTGPAPRNPYHARVAELEEQLRRTYDPRQREQIEKKLFQYRLAAEDRAAEIGEHRADRSAEKALAPAIERAAKQLEVWSTADIDQSIIDELAAGIEAARSTHDGEALLTLIDQVRGKAAMQRSARAEGLKMQIAERQAAIDKLESLDDEEIRQVHGGSDATQ